MSAIKYAPTDFSKPVSVAGAFDRFSAASGLCGWAVYPQMPLRPVEIEVICAGVRLGQSYAMLRRADINDLLKSEARAGFEIDFRDLDLERLKTIAIDSPDEEISIGLARESMRLRSFCPPLDAAGAISLLRESSRLPRRESSAALMLHVTRLFDGLIEEVEGHPILDAGDRAILAVSLIERGTFQSTTSDSVILNVLRKSLALAARASSQPTTRQAVIAAPPFTRFTDDLAFASFIRENALLDIHRYREICPDCGEDPWLHFAQLGDKAGASPNEFFEPLFYIQQSKGLPFDSWPPFRHYLEVGEAHGISPSPMFEMHWYAATHRLELGGGAVLTHYLNHRSRNVVSPNRYFDAAQYLAAYPDVRDAGVDAFRHFCDLGQFEGRISGAAFDARYIRARYLNNDYSKDAFRIFMETGRELGWQAVPGGDKGTIAAEIRRFAAPGSGFKPLMPPGERAPAPDVKAYAFYLPQFHAIPENDVWWGAGFTEWTNLGRGVPRFVGHYQPRIPRDLGHYNLLDGVTLRRQVELARMMGLAGFGFYYYNFNTHRLLEKPLDLFCADPQLDFPFFLIWANENWTRRWDGMEREVLIAQEYRAEDQATLVDDMARYMAHPAYVRLNGRPLFCVYRADAIPDCAQTIAGLKAELQRRHGLDVCFAMAQSFGAEDPADFGFDVAFEFPPHKIGSLLPRISHAMELLDTDFTGEVVSYEAVVDWARSDPPAAFPLIRSVFPSWDNDARRQGNGGVYHGSTPQLFADWVQSARRYAKAHPIEGEALMFVNAWNEWCEGAYLEPDVHFGYAYLNALSSALRPEQAWSGAGVVLVGHDAFRSGAQRLLLNIGRTLTSRFGIRVRYLLLGDGDLRPDYEAVAPVTLLPDSGPAMREKVAGEFFERCRAEGFDKVILNTVVSGTVADAAARVGLPIVSLIHELAATIQERHLEGAYQAIARHARTVVFASRFVERELAAGFGPVSGQVVIRPQGVYRPFAANATARAYIRQRLGVATGEALVLAVGHADFRKAPDVFLDVAHAASLDGFRAKFVWVGSQHLEFMNWVERDRRRRGLDNVLFQGPSEEVDDFLAAADVFFLPSREDPFPTVVLEALGAGLPVVAFAESGGHADLLQDDRLGTLVPYLDAAAAALALRRYAGAKSDALADARAMHRRRLITESFDFADYCWFLNGLDADVARVSVIVPNYNYARYLNERLSSIFRQTYPVFEVIVLDDASSDESRSVVEAACLAFGRQVRWVPRETNSGSVFRQWKAGLDLARGDYVWIAEADDASDPRFLDRMLAALRSGDDVAFGFSDSAAIDGDGVALYPDYKGYYREQGDTLLDRDGLISTGDMVQRVLFPRNLILNASAVVWSATRLRETFESLGEEAFRMRCAGDWRIYAEACRARGSVAYVAEPLNLHRRHGESVTHALDHARHHDEIRTVLQDILAREGGSAQRRRAAEDYLRTLRDAWRL